MRLERRTRHNAKRVSYEEEAECVQKLKANQEVERRKEEEIVKKKEACRERIAVKEIRRKMSFKLQKPSLKKEVNSYLKRLETKNLVMLLLLQGYWKLPRREWLVLCNKESHISVNESYLKVQGREF